jgi:hypothetical protein
MSLVLTAIKLSKRKVLYLSDEEIKKFFEEVLKRLEEISNHQSDISKKLDFLVGTKIEEKRKSFDIIYKTLIDKIVMSWSEVVKINSTINKNTSARVDFLNFCRLKGIEIVELPMKGRPKFLVLVFENEIWLKKILANWDKIVHTGVLLSTFPPEEREFVKDFLLSKFGFYFQFVSSGDCGSITPKKRLKKIK